VSGSIHLSSEQRAQVSRYAARAYPEECCGVLIGRRSGSAAQVDEILPTENRAEDRTRRYEIDPKALIDAHLTARERGAEVVGYYHSHPESPAVPSERDRSTAWTDTSYLIVRVERGGATGIRSWSLSSGEGAFREEEVCLG